MPRAKAPAWTSEEIAVLHEIYPVGGINAVTDLLPERSWQAIFVMASRLGIRSTVVTEAPKARLQGDRLERAIVMREEQGWSFARIGAELGVSEASACNAVLIALCTRKGFRPAERDAKGRLLPEGIERLRYALRKGYKGVDIQLRLGLSAGRIAEERRRYSAELKAAGKVPLPPPGGGEAYSGVKVSRAMIAAIEAAFMEGLGTLKVHERTGASKTTILRARDRLIGRLSRKGQCLPGCDIGGKRVRYTDHFFQIPDAARAEFRRLILVEGMSARRAGLHAGIGGSEAYRMREAIVADFEAAGLPIPSTRRLPSRGPAYRRVTAEDALLPTGKAAMAAYRQYAAAHGYPAARQKLADDRAAAAAAAREEARRPKSFEEQLALVAAGKARVVANIPLRRPDPTGTLGGVATGAL
ncbi:hypothetical protein DAH55_03950 [Sphingomonas koreensis]|uniref:hypothetical protein n=1 Tax=Sphingomonas koreensis TaxID=93064 RepID=UPI00082F6A25|nr:hypothetical protein [Sphingomonas koreensis]PJI89044.1 hypothetical protein BDW16_2348 [Sphingomonas koreensis]RSU63374.1 hypothetical protein DAH56_00405 [Sphingomonas koreensis]RSU71039.1 hypothetical protein DAH55_03950 [Sphingomonas koreensis]